MAKLKNGIFDKAPKTQSRKTNKLNFVIQAAGLLSFTGIFILIVIVDMPKFIPKYILVVPPIFLASLSLFGLYEVIAEANRIRKTALVIEGLLDNEKQFIKGSFSNEPVWFSVATRPMSINYGIRVNGNQAVQQRQRLEQYIFNELAANNIRGFKALITQDTLILSKYFMIAFQIVPEKTAEIYSALIRAKREIIK